MKSAALQREAEMLRSMVEKQKTQIHQLQDLLANREQQHRFIYSSQLCPLLFNRFIVIMVSVCLSVYLIIHSLVHIYFVTGFSGTTYELSWRHNFVDDT